MAGEIVMEVVMLAGLTVAGGWVMFVMRRAADEARDAGTWRTPWGEVSEVPDELRLPSKKAGDDLGRPGSRFTGHGSHSHDGTAL